MPKEKIGKDVTKKKASGIISTPAEHEEYERFLEEREKQKQEEIKEKMPEEQPTDEELARERAKEGEELAKAKAEGKLVHVKEHHRSHPHRTGIKTDEEEEGK